MLNSSTKEGLLMAGHQDFDSWTLIVILRGRKWLFKRMDLGGLLYECNLVGFSTAEGMGKKGNACQNHVGHFQSG